MRIHFNLRNGPQLVKDVGGIELASPDQARLEALVCVRELRSAGEIPAEEFEGWSLELVTESGETLMLLPLTDSPEAALQPPDHDQDQAERHPN